jgi:hypothetical protein
MLQTSTVCQQQTHEEKKMYNMFGGGSPYVATMPMEPAGTAKSDNSWGANNPFVYLIWMWAFAMFGGGWGNGFGRNGSGLGQGLGMAEGFTASQVDDIRTKVGEIASSIECGNSGLMSAANQIADQARLNGMQISDVKSSLLNACCELQHNLSTQGLQFANQMQQCCCALENKIGEVGCGMEKGLLNQTIQLNNNHSNTMQAFANISAQIDRQTCAISDGLCTTQRLISAEAQTTRQLVQDLHMQDILALKDAEIAALRDKVQLTQSENIATVASMTAADKIIAALKTTSA